MSDAVAGLNTALDQVQTAALRDSDSVGELVRAGGRHEAELAAAIGRWDADKAWAAEGARSPASWIAIRCRIDKKKASRLLRLARACREMPRTDEAWRAGDVQAEHVQVLAAVRHIDGFAEDEALLVDDAKTMRFTNFVKAVDHWRLLHDEDEATKKAQKQIDDRRFDFSRTFQNNWIGDIRSDPISGEIIDVTMRTIEHELWEQDWAEAKERLGRDPLPVELARTPTQRRHDALVEMAIRARASPADGQRPAPLFHVLCGYERFQQICELASGTVVPPGTLVTFLNDAWVERVVFDGPSRVIDVGAEQRIFRGATREAVSMRELLDGDGTCFDDLCDVPFWLCQIDHTKPWSEGGPTIQSNGRLACGPHNRKRNRKKKRRRRPDDG